MRRITEILFALLTAMLLPLASGAQDEAVPGSGYIELQPPFVCSFGTEGRVRYLKVDVSLRVLEAEAASIRAHVPRIRHELLMLFSRQNEEAVGSMPGREALRQEALELVRAALEEEHSAQGLEDVLFPTFVVQR